MTCFAEVLANLARNDRTSLDILLLVLVGITRHMWSWAGEEQTALGTTLKKRKKRALSPHNMKGEEKSSSPQQ